MLRIQASKLNLNTEKQSHFSAQPPLWEIHIYLDYCFHKEMYYEECNLVKIRGWMQGSKVTEQSER